MPLALPLLLLLGSLHPLLVPALVCNICRHDGISMQLTQTPHVRFIFNAQTPDCDVEEQVCSANEGSCVSGVVGPQDGVYWVQKGCLPGDPVDEASCGEEPFRPLESDNLPIPSTTRQRFQLLCYCSTDLCNTGPVGRGNHHRLSFLFCQLMVLLLLLL